MKKNMFVIKDDLQSWRRRSYNILNHSKWRRIEKDRFAKVFVIVVSTPGKGRKKQQKRTQVGQD